MHFWASREEYNLILKNVVLSGSTNLSAFLRKMAIDGMVIKLDMPEIREILKLLRRTNANINQIAKHLYETGRIPIRIWRKYSDTRKRFIRDRMNC